MSNRVSGIITVKQNGEIHNAKGSFTYNLGRNKNEAVVGADRTHGYKSLPQVAYIEGEITDRQNLDLEQLLTSDGQTITIELANGKTIVLKDAWYAADGNVETEEANIQYRFEGMSAEEIR